MAKSKQKFGDIVENHDLVKRTLMVSAFPALIKEVKNNEGTLYSGFLPGFEFSQVDDVETEDELVEILQDMLDDEVEELVVFGKSLPNLPEDEELLKNNKGYKIAYLDINVYASKDDEDFYDCTHDCCSCGGHCHDDLDDYCDEECDCEDNDDNCSCEDECCNHHKHDKDEHKNCNCKKNNKNK